MSGRLGRRALCIAVLLGLSACVGDPTPPSYPGDFPVNEPTAGTWKTWVLVAPDQVAVPPPPAPGSGESSAELDELRGMTTRRGGPVDENIRRWDRDPIVTPWTELHTNLQKSRPPDPPITTRQEALLNVAVYDAVVSAWHWKYVYNRPAPTGVGGVIPPGSDPSYPSEHAVIAGAASRMLSYLFPERPSNLLDQLANDAGLSRVQAGVNFRSDVEQGLTLGRGVADVVIKRARSDGTDVRWDGRRPPHGPARWEPPPNTDTPPLEPIAGFWKSWVIDTGLQFRAPPPPPPGSAIFDADSAKVVSVATHRTKQQERLANEWNETTGGMSLASKWTKTALDLAHRDHLTTPRVSRVLALAGVAQADATIAAWDTKYAHWAPRPVNAIRDLKIDVAFNSLIPTPSYPGFASQHASDSTAAGDVLGFLFPRDAKDLQARAKEAGISRLYGGVNFPIDITTGEGIGRDVAKPIIARAREDGSGH